MNGATIVGAAIALAAIADASPASLAERIRGCAACHGIDGNSTMPGSPSLAAQPTLFLETQLVLIREGVRPIAAMQGLLDGLTDAELAAMAQHFSQRPLHAAQAEIDEARAQRGRSLAEREQCASCHSPRYLGQQHVPRLAGQREDYLVRSMRELRTNRASGRDTMMSAVLQQLTDRDLADVAHYLATLR
jgi:cytochrome c553